MRIAPAIAALQRDRAPQRRAQAAVAAACDAWRASAPTERVLAEFARYGGGAPLARCPTLFALFIEQDAAPQWIAGLVHAFCTALVGEPLGHPPFRHGYDRGVSTLLLARSGRAQLVLHAAEPGFHAFDVVSFTDGQRREAVLAGEARARIVSRCGQSGPFAERRVTLGAGARLALDLRDEALQVMAIERRLVSLRLQRSARTPAPTREYDLSSGTLLRQAAGDIRFSRHEMMLALLGRMGRTEAVPVMAEIAREPGDDSLRWQALRECLALDTAVGLAALDHIRRDEHDPLAGFARALYARLHEAHPALAELVVVPCHA